MAASGLGGTTTYHEARAGALPRKSSAEGDKSPNAAERGSYSVVVNDTGEGARRATGPRRALVVDDAPDIAHMLRCLLENAGYDVDVAHSGTAALEATECADFDVVISDIGLPGMDGYELLSLLRATPSYAKTPIIAITGFAKHSDNRHALDSGFDAHLTKPINPLTLLTLLDQLCG